LASGAQSICLRATATITPAQMLIYGKEATTQIENSVPYYSVSSGAVTRKCCCSIFMPLK
jgi:hypothetical protein